MKQLKKFAQIMKWPNLRETMECLRQKDEDFALDSISSDAFAYFSGLVLPGVSELWCSGRLQLVVKRKQSSEGISC